MQIGQDGLFQSLYLRKWAAKVEGGITMKTRKVRRDMSRMLENMCFWLYTVYVNKIGGVTIRKVRSESSGKISGKRRGEREGRSL